MSMPTHNLMSNLMVDGTRGVQPEVGMGATLCYYSDRHAATIVEVHPEKRMIVVQQDTAIRTDKSGMSDSQDYRYEPNAAGALYHYRFNTKKQTWERVTLNTKTLRFNLAGHPALIVGKRDEYYDFSF